LEQIAHDLAEGAVVVYNKNRLPMRRFGAERRWYHVRASCNPWLSEKPLRKVH
jgi:hypothetical protein